MAASMQSDTKYILVTGGVISGLGKGIVASSIGVILKACGVRVTMIKIDPYLNIDAGTFSPFEHGEVYVLDDGGEVDLDLGNYERFLDITLQRENNITTGKVYETVIKRERRGDYLGKTVQVVPHVTNEIQDWVQRVGTRPTLEDGLKPEVCIIELGGTIGDIEGMAFVEAFRQFKCRVGEAHFCAVHCSLAPESGGEHKTKPTQASVRELRGLGINPDFILIRSVTGIERATQEKISMFTNVDADHVLSVPNVDCLYKVPLLLEEQGFVTFIAKRLSLGIQKNKSKRSLAKWRELCTKTESLSKTVTISLVGKYTRLLSEAYLSVLKALEHAATACNCRLNLVDIEAGNLEAEMLQTDPEKYHTAWQLLCKSEGVLVPGGFGDRGVEGKVAACRWAREKKVPFLGVCLGMQCAVIEFARNILKMEKANSTEFNPSTPHDVVIDMPEHNQGTMGGTMRLGKRRTTFKTEASNIRQLYGNPEFVEERHRHRYEVNPANIAAFEKRGLLFVGQDGDRMEVMELVGHPYFVGTQYHPEYLSRPMKPSPPYLGLVLAATGKLGSFLQAGCRLSPRSFSFTHDNDGTEEDEGESLRELEKSLNSGLFRVQTDPSLTLAHDSTSSTASSPDSGRITLPKFD